MTPKLFDIFSKNEAKNKKETPKQKIIVDYREKNSLVISELVKMNFEIDLRELKVADYLVKDVAIERKTVNDFISSMKNHRLVNQLEGLQQYEKKLLIIEGIEEQELYTDSEESRFSSEAKKKIALQSFEERAREKQGVLSEGMHPNSVRGFIISILLKHNVPIIYTKDYKDTAKFISVLAKRTEKEASLNVKKKALNKKEQLQFIIESFPGIGPANSKKLLDKFGSIRNIVNASQENLEKAIGKKAEIFKLVEEEYQ